MSQPEGLPKETVYFYLIHSFMEYGTIVWDPYQKYNSDKIERVQHIAARFVKSRCTRYSNVSDVLNGLGWLPLSQSRLVAQLIFFYEKLLTVWQKCSRFSPKLLVHGTGLVSLKLHHWLNLDNILF